MLLVGLLQPAYLCLSTNFRGSKPLFLQTIFSRLLCFPVFLDVKCVSIRPSEEQKSSINTKEARDKHGWDLTLAYKQQEEHVGKTKRNLDIHTGEKMRPMQIMVMNLMAQGCCTCVSPAA